MHLPERDDQFEIMFTYIMMPDGVKLSAKVWLPRMAWEEPVPAILEFLPYRHQDGSIERDEITHRYFARNGYASVRVDIRGTGNSQGIIWGEYIKQEQDDALAILEWIEAQPWCSGKTGMIGISWGGFNGLQIAARKPKSLKAVVSICSTDDRYNGDCHYMGGCLLSDTFNWGSTAFSVANYPPDPEVVGPVWKDMWQERLEADNLWLEDWLEHQTFDDFYKQGSVCEDFGAIEAAVYAVGGWSDGYSNSVFSLLKGLPGPKKGLVGPWGHKYPNLAKPEPAIDFLQECVRWWDHWLKDIDTGIMDEPTLQCWIEDPHPPQTFYPKKPGRWVAQAEWPTKQQQYKHLWLEGSNLSKTQSGQEEQSISSPQNTGSHGGSWCPYGAAHDEAGDQRKEEGGSLIFDSAPLENDFDVLGAPELSIQVASDQAFGMIAVCLSEVHPDGAVSRVSYGVLNLTHRDSHEFPEELVPDEFYSLNLALNEIGHRFGAGNRIRVAISNAYWPTVWPMPGRFTLTVRENGAQLTLPSLEETDESKPTFFDPPANIEDIVCVKHTNPERTWALQEDLCTGKITMTLNDQGAMTEYLDHDGWCRQNSYLCEQSVHPDVPLSAELLAVQSTKFTRRDWSATTITTIGFSATETHFQLQATLEAWHGDTMEYRKEWIREIPRNLM